MKRLFSYIETVMSIQNSRNENSKAPCHHISTMIIKWTILLTCLFPIYQFIVIEVDYYELYAKSSKNGSVRGDSLHLGESPFTVIFYETEIRTIFKSRSYLTPICSGAVVSTRWVLTTANPLGRYSLNNYFMFAGVLKIGVDPWVVLNATRNVYHIEVMLVHPDWHQYAYNDVGLARTSARLILGRELGVMRIPLKFKPASNNITVCTMFIWASAVNIDHLMGYYQTVAISKQKIKFRVANGPMFCPENVFTNKTLCLMQDKPDIILKDVCAVNHGAVVRCNCKTVGLFTGINGELSCVDIPPLKYTAVNLVYYTDWIDEIINLPLPNRDDFFVISEFCATCVNVKLASLSAVIILITR